MLIGKEKYFTKDHIKEHISNTSPILTEQVVHCLELVALLSHLGLNFMFKGGNSLLVLLEHPRRFSIDVDIATDEKKEYIEEILDKLILKSDVFTKWERRPHKTKIWLPMSSYYIFYNSHFTDPSETSIMLDAQLKMSQYKKINKTVKCGDFYKSNQEVLVPTVSSLIGDKLLTLGPSTLGIPLNKNKEAQRLKHSFDISLLCNNKPDIEEIRESINICLEQENNLQGKNFDLKTVFQDTINFCGSVVKYKHEPDENLSPYLQEIVIGRKPFAEHIWDERYTWQDLQTDLARTAFCFTSVICNEISTKDFQLIMSQDCKEDCKIDNKEDCFTELSNNNPQAFFYWNNILKYLGKNPIS